MSEPTTTPVVDRPPAPDGHVYASDVLAVVRTLAVAYSWCSSAEFFAARAVLGRDAGHPFMPWDEYCCVGCHGSHDEYVRRYGRKEGFSPRFTLAPKHGDPVLSAADVREALSDVRDEMGYNAFIRLTADLSKLLGVSAL